MTIKMFQLLEFQSFYNEIKDKKMPLKTAYKFSKLLSKLDNEINFYQEKLQQILSKYGKKDKNGEFLLTEDKKGIQIKEDEVQNCQKEMEELHNLDIEISGITFSLDELEVLDMTIGEMNIIMPLIEE